MSRAVRSFGDVERRGCLQGVEAVLRLVEGSQGVSAVEDGRADLLRVTEGTVADDCGGLWRVVKGLKYPLTSPLHNSTQDKAMQPIPTA